jgi:hypothetical protein
MFDSICLIVVCTKKQFDILPGNDHEVEFHEIEIQLFQEVEFLIMRSKFLIMNILQKRSGDRIGPRGPKGARLG